MINHLIKKSYNNIFNQLYKITNGKIILSGSLSLKYQNIIDRDVNDLDVNILSEDWEQYKSELQRVFRIYPEMKIKYDILHYDVYMCLDKETKLISIINFRLELLFPTILLGLQRIITWKKPILDRTKMQILNSCFTEESSLIKEADLELI
mgnify:CR=1 FL=1